MVSQKISLNGVAGCLSDWWPVWCVFCSSFVTALQKGKSGKVPGTDRTYTIEDKYVPKFKASKVLKEKIAFGK